VSPAQWIALVARDGGCVAPDHDCPPVYTQAHHWRRSWIDGGTTDLADLALVCTFTHHLIHDDGAELYLDPHHYWTMRMPDGQVLRGLRLGQTALGRASQIADQASKKPRGP
jgi:hypothetical protein